MISYNKNQWMYSTRFIELILSMIVMGSSLFAQEPYTWLVQKFEIPELGILNPAGIAFSRAAGTFFVAPRLNATEFMVMSNTGRMLNSVTVGTAIPNPINIAFNDKTNSVVFFDAEAGELVEINAKRDERLDISPESVTRYNVKPLNANHLEGITFDPETGDAFFLVVPGPPESARIIHVIPHPLERFDAPAIRRDDRIYNLVLSSLPQSQLRGIAFNPDDGHLYVMSLADQRLYELTEQGEVVSARDVSAFELSDVQNMLFAPSGDQTDDPSIQSLYIMDSGRSLGQGGISELTLLRPKPHNFSPMALQFTLIRNVHTSEWSPPSPDASGITYIPSSNHLLICDGEVDEPTWNPPIWGGANVWEVTLSGNQVREFNTLAFSEEPTDVAYNPNNQHLYFSDDTGTKSVYELDPGSDGLYGTGDDIFTSIRTGDFGSDDPEGVTYDTHQGHLFSVDGVNREVYDIDPGPNNMFGDGDDVVTHFDTQSLGAEDPEGIEFNPDNGNLYIMGSNDIIIETTRNGTYLEEIDLASLNISKPAGLAYAPTSTNPLQKSLYIVARGTDNDGHPTENDGELYEISLGSFTPNLSIDNAGVLEGDNGTVNAVFTVTLSSATQDVVTVDYATADSSATAANNDYVPTSGQVTFQPGETSQPIIVMVNGDGIDEPDEAFFVNLSDAVNAPIGDDQGIGTIINDDGPELVTISFQDGINGYNGTRDTWIEGGAPSANHGNDATLYIDGSPFLSSLLYWDLAVLPSGSTVETVDIQVNVLDVSSTDYELYELKRPWIEGEATWNEYATGQNWQTAGADGSADRGLTVLATTSGNSLGFSTFSLNAAGVAVVQSWVGDPSLNHGFIVQNYSNTNGLDLSSRETATVSQRPKLTVSYTNPPSLTVTSPDGGEIWEGGSTENITWNSEGTSGTVKIEYSADDGLSWSDIIVSTADSGSYLWTIPDTSTNEALLRITDTDGNGPADTSDAVFAITPAQVLVEVKMFLEGPYDASGDTMRTDLKANGFIPDTSIYAEDPRFVPAVPDKVVDWVLVQLRETASDTAVASRSAFLRNDGRIVADDGITPTIMMDAGTNFYYIVIKHRNHLAVMSADSVQLSSDSSTLYDFTTGSEKFYGTGGAKEIETDVWGMWSADIDQSGTVDANDRAASWNDRNKTGYFDTDCKLGGTVDANSRAITWNNRNKISTLP